MITAQELLTLIPQDGSLLMNFTRTKDGKITVAIHPRLSNIELKNIDKAVLEQAAKPSVITATPEELDSSFMALVKSVSEKKMSLQEELQKIDKDYEAAIKEAKESGDKKVKDAEKTAAAAAKSKARTTSKPSAVAKPAVAEKQEDEGGEDCASAGAETAEPAKVETQPAQTTMF